MKSYQLFTEQLKTGPQINDYVICNLNDNFYSKILENYINNNIGQITQFNNKLYFVKYNKPKNILTEFSILNFLILKIRKEEIIFFSPNIEDCEIYLTTKNFNL